MVGVVFSDRVGIDDAVTTSVGRGGGGEICTAPPPAKAVAVMLMVLTSIVGKNGSVGPAVAGVPSGVAVIIALGGVAVMVPPPMSAVGNGVPNAKAV